MPQHDQILLVNSDPSCIYRSKLLDFYSNSDVNQPTILEFDSFESILQAANDGLGISILPEDVIYRRKKTNTLHYQKLPERVKIDFVIKRGKQKPHSLKKFIYFLQE
ncbi:LysR substrate-binding domain-containing protein [Priestia abyssalis]|uniref:LysR substrate-binding domain-containing protein n=1 Tax=Priestia abyssalis TaxID=1221450 RepID=UPI001F41EECE|nr:LysR substrate-binding domain-containing protein [Priestia abyssalis]